MYSAARILSISCWRCIISIRIMIRTRWRRKQQNLSMNVLVLFLKNWAVRKRIWKVSNVGRVLRIWPVMHRSLWRVVLNMKRSVWRIKPRLICCRICRNICKMKVMRFYLVISDCRIWILLLLSTVIMMFLLRGNVYYVHQQRIILPL